MTFELLEHPADIGFRVRAESLPGLFAGCAEALVSIILDPAGIRLTGQVALAAEGGDLESLMVNWLSEVLYYTDGRRMALGAFEISRLDPMRIECIARGELRDESRHPAKLIVKAVTYHQLKVAETASGWVAEVYVDI